jgi:peptidylprolyl isomerase
LKKFALSLSALIVAGTMTGCAQSVNFACDPVNPGDQVKSVSVSSNFGETPVVSFPSPLTSETIQSLQVVKGNGTVFTGRNLMEFELALYNGGTGELLQQTTFDGSDSPTEFFGPNEYPSFCNALVGAKEGSRIVAIVPPTEAHSGEGIPNLGVSPTDSFVFVFDIRRVFLEKATGSSVATEAGLPAVVTTVEGIPGVTIPKTAPPSDLRIAQLIRGSGDEVEMGQLVTLHYSGFLWSNSEKFDSSWDSGRPAQFQLLEGGLIEGFLKAVVGQPVGSQVIAVIPPGQAYGEAGAGTIPPGATLVFIIDILGTND